MTLDLVLPASTRPSNLHMDPAKVHASLYKSDVYDICYRIQEISDDLYVLLLEGQEDKYAFAIMESCKDGVERLCFKVGPASPRFPQLDARVVNHLRKLYAMPLSQRLRELEKEEAQYLEDQKEAELDELYERVGRPMWTQLDHDGFIPGGRGVSYPKSGVTAGKGSVKRS